MQNSLQIPIILQGTHNNIEQFAKSKTRKGTK